MAKKNKTPLGIFTESIGLYFSNFEKFIKYMTFPVLGQVTGLLIIFSLLLFYSNNMPNLINKFPTLANFNTLFIIGILIVLPGLILFTKSFWEYLVAYGAINSMLENMLKSGKVYDFDAHTELIKRRSIPFVGLWILFGIYTLFFMIPLISWIPCIVMAVYFVLIFQVFTYEPELSPIGCLKKSFQLVNGHFASTFMLMALVGALTYILIPEIINTFCEVAGLSNILAKFSEPLVKMLPIMELNNFLISFKLKPISINSASLFFVSVFIAQIFIQYTLPLRSILWGMWYRELNGSLPKQTEVSKTKHSTKKPSEKLMKESHKKFTSKKLDKNILKRVMEKDED